MAILAVNALIEVLQQSRLLEPTQLEMIEQTLKSQCSDAPTLGQELVKLGWLTHYQMEQFLLGRGQDLVLGHYVLIEPIGKGTVGHVFKARHQKKGHVVALKVIRKDRRADEQVLRRFRREVRAITRLSHPNLIKACDVEEVGNAHYYAMEFVPGANLDELIQQGGAMPIAPACDYTRQTALGLQHAHERGLIHRDIKPANLLIAPPTAEQAARGPSRQGCWGTVKLLDMGLALLQHPFQTGGAQHLTQVGFAVGTADYMAPEQVASPHDVDIRADLYALGCTLYHMLTGRPPFAEGTLLAKFQAHQTREPEPVEKLRPEVPPAVAGVVRKLMAKSPADRYQTPLELASTLANVMNRLDNALLAADWQLPAEVTQVLASKRKRFTQMPAVSAAVAAKGTGRRSTQLPRSEKKEEPEPEPGLHPIWPVGVGIVIFVLSFLLFWFLMGR